MRLIILPLISLLTFPLIGCSPPPPPVEVTEPLFCDIEEPRRFTQEELDVRAERWPANLRRDFKTNAAWDAEECDKPDPA